MHQEFGVTYPYMIIDVPSPPAGPTLSGNEDVSRGNEAAVKPPYFRDRKSTRTKGDGCVCGNQVPLFFSVNVFVQSDHRNKRKHWSSTQLPLLSRSSHFVTRQNIYSRSFTHTDFIRVFNELSAGREKQQQSIQTINLVCPKSA